MVIVVTTRSGLGVIEASWRNYGLLGQLRTARTAARTSLTEETKLGNFISVGGLNTSRFLDGPEYATIHDHGNRAEYLRPPGFQGLAIGHSQHQPGLDPVVVPDSEFLRLAECDGMVGAGGGQRGTWARRQASRRAGSAFQDPNLQHRSGLDASAQRQQRVYTIGGFIRQDQYNYYPSANPFADLTPGGLQAQTIGQDRTLKNLGVRVNYSYSSKASTTSKLGATYQDTILTEKDNLGMVDPTANAPCVNADGSPDHRIRG